MRLTRRTFPLALVLFLASAACGADFWISKAKWFQIEPAVAYGNGQYLVAWSDSRNDLPRIYAARVTPDGTVLDPAGLALPISPREAVSPSVAFGSGRFFLAWQDAC